MNNGDRQPGEEELIPNGIRKNCEINCAGDADIDAPFLELSAVNINVDEQSNAEVPLTPQMSAVCHVSETILPVQELTSTALNPEILHSDPDLSHVESSYDKLCPLERISSPEPEIPAVSRSPAALPVCGTALYTCMQTRKQNTHHKIQEFSKKNYTHTVCTKIPGRNTQMPQTKLQQKWAADKVRQRKNQNAIKECYFQFSDQHMGNLSAMK